MGHAQSHKRTTVYFCPRARARAGTGIVRTGGGGGS